MLDTTPLTIEFYTNSACTTSLGTVDFFSFVGSFVDKVEGEELKKLFKLYEVSLQAYKEKNTKLETKQRSVDETESRSSQYLQIISTMTSLEKEIETSKQLQEKVNQLEILVAELNDSIVPPKEEALHLQDDDDASAHSDSPSTPPGSPVPQLKTPPSPSAAEKSKSPVERADRSNRTNERMQTNRSRLNFVS